MSRPDGGAGPGIADAGPDPSLDGIVRELAEGLEQRVADLLVVTATVVRGLSDEPGAGDVATLIDEAAARADAMGADTCVPSLVQTLARADALARQLASALADLYVFSRAEAGSEPLRLPAPPALRSPR